MSVNIGFPSEFERLLAITVADAADLFPNQIGAVSMLAEQAHAKWLSYASGNDTPPSGIKINPRTGSYLRSIKLEPDGDGMGYRVFADTNIAPYAASIEHGRSAWDMHSLLRTSDKVRMSKSGSRYLIIPFRHGTPEALVVGAYSGNQMPTDVYKGAVTMSQSSVLGSAQMPNADGNDVTRLRYRWGNRLTLSDLGAMGHDMNSRDTQRMAGMVRMSSNTDKAVSSTYVTFRVLSENSPGWVVPAREGAEPAKAVLEWLRGSYEDIMSKALELDIARIESLVGF